MRPEVEKANSALNVSPPVPKGTVSTEITGDRAPPQMRAERLRDLDFFLVLSHSPIVSLTRF
jgi:hypothetical protein